ncbi:MAG: Ig-like domain-containing protein [Actinomycetota bacterium]|nr:Ig-like domain-containing protein [Actinomycetota bacterium]
MSRRRSVVLLAVAMALVLAGCGSSSTPPGLAGGASAAAPATGAPAYSPSVVHPQPGRITVAPQSETGPPTDVALATTDPGVSSAATLPARSMATAATRPTINTTNAKPTPRPTPKPAVVTVIPEFGSDTLNPAGAATVKATGGHLSTLAVYAEDGSKITGTMSADRTSWSSTQRLRYGGSYHAVGEASGQPGSAATKIDGSWKTLSADTQTTRISPGNGGKVGVAVPIIIRFGACVADHAAVQKHVTVTTTPKVAVSGTWVQHDGDECRSLDVRPQGFWPAGTRVHVAVDLLGVEVSDGLYGGRDVVTSDFTIQRNLVTYADAKTHMITVKRAGVLVARYPTSMGRGDDVGDTRMTTRSGIHIVLDKDATKKMSNPKFGYKDLPEPWSVRISNNGEFIHQNMNTIDQQGVSNQSHGCLNLSDVNAKAYFNMVVYGDPVVVTGTSVKLSASDGDIYDWAIPWDQWTPISA